MYIRIITAVCLLIIALISCKEKTNSLIIGDVRNIQGAIVTLKSEDYKTSYLADTVKDNTFRFEINSLDEGFYQVDFVGKYPDKKHLTGWNHPVIIYLEKNCTYKVIANSDKDILYNKYNVISSSPVQKKLTLYNNGYQLKYSALKEKADAKKKQAIEHFENNDTNEYEKLWDEAIKEEYYYQKVFPLEYIRKFAKDNPNSIVSTYQLLKAYDLQENYQDYVNIYNNLISKVKNQHYGKLFKGKLDTIKNVAFGQSLPKIAGKNLNGKKFDFDFSKKKITLIDFWASWCIPCREINPELVTLYKTFHSKGFDVISISFDDDFEDWQTAVKKDKLEWPNHFSDLKKLTKSDNSINFNISYIPQNYLVDDKGVIIRKNIELNSLEILLELLTKDL